MTIEQQDSPNKSIEELKERLAAAEARILELSYELKTEETVSRINEAASKKIGDEYAAIVERAEQAEAERESAYAEGRQAGEESGAAELEEARRTIERLCGELVQTQARAEELIATVKRQRDYIEALESDVRILFAQRNDLRAALEAVEWHDNSGKGKGGDSDWPQCPWCKLYKSSGHRSSCQRQAALSGETGE